MVMVLCFPNVLINAKVSGYKFCTIVADRLPKHVAPTSASIIFGQKCELYEINIALPNTHSCLLQSNSCFLLAMEVQALNEDFLLLSS